MSAAGGGYDQAMTTDTAAKSRSSRALPLRGAAEQTVSFLLFVPIPVGFWWLLTPLSFWLALAVVLLWVKASPHIFAAWQRRWRNRRRERG